MMDSKKEPATFESLPEDVIPYIVGFIKSWAEVKATGINLQKEKKMARRFRDSALSAVTATSRENYQKWLPHLLEEVSLPVSNLPKFFFLLSRMPHSGSLVKTLRIEIDTQEDDQNEAYKLFEQLWVSFSESLERTLAQGEFISELLKELFVRCINLQTLILIAGMPLVDKSGFPFRFLTHSLKRLFVDLSIAETADHLTEYASTFERLSNVTQLSISSQFLWNADKADERSWKGYRKAKEGLIGGNLETQAIHNLLRVTKNLSSLEIENGRGEKSQLGSHIYPDCLGGISGSFHSIKHLQLVLIPLQPLSSVRLRLSALRNLKILSVDYGQLRRFRTQSEGSESLEILHLPYYIFTTKALSENDLPEELIISAIIDREIFPNLQRVAVPSLLAGPDGRVSSDLAQIQVWKNRRQELMDNESIKRGKIKLMTLDLGETVGDVSKGEISAHDTISHFPA